MARDRILISELRVDCIVGVLAHERLRTQPLLIDLELGIDIAEAAYTGQLAATCDYARVAREIAALLEFRRYELLEVAASELAAMVIGIHPMVEDVRLRLRKPMALPGHATIAGLEIYREARELPRTYTPTEWGEVERLHETREAGRHVLFLQHIEPQRSLEINPALAWWVGGALERDGERLDATAPLVSPAREPRAHRYVNVGEQRATLFCCDSDSDS